MLNQKCMKRLLTT